MAATNNKRELSRPRYEVERYVTSIHDNDASFTVRRNGKVFYIRVSPSQFVQSPATTKKDLSHLEVVGDIFDTNVLE
jgi:hypothetical protein